jgi:membrane protease subunit (stomatin/prohibitin family)
MPFKLVFVTPTKKNVLFVNVEDAEIKYPEEVPIEAYSILLVGLDVKVAL